MYKYIIDKLKQYPECVYEYFQQVEQKCKQHGVKLKVVKRDYIPTPDKRDIGVGGFFDETSAILGVSIGCDDVHGILGVLLHEESHMDQWIEKDSIWHNQSATKKINAFWEWLYNPEYKIPKKFGTVDKCCTACIDLEIDCELRAIKKFKKYFPEIFDNDRYIKSCNAYFYFIRYMTIIRGWPNISPFDVEELLEVCSSRLKSDYLIIPSKIKEVLDKYYGQQFTKSIG